MNFKKARLWLLCRALEALFSLYILFLRLLPAILFLRLTAPTLKILISLLIPKRRVVKNISRAFGESYSPATKRGIARGVQDHFAKNLMDCFLQLACPEHARTKVSISGKENLDAALAGGNGVIALGAHIGNFVLVGTRLGMEGYPFSTLFRLPADPRLGNLIHHYLPGFHQRIIPSRPKRAAVRRLLDALKENEIVFILVDNLRKGNVRTVFFGQRVFSPRGPVSLALRSRAAVVPMYLIRNYEGGLDLVIEPEILLIRSGNMYEDISANTRKIVRHLESLIRRYPDQWSWLTVRMKKNADHAEKMRGGEFYSLPDRDRDLA